MLSLFSPAKINLFLRVVSKRPDGYHELSSLFQTISLGDRLEITCSEKDRFICTDPHLPTNSSNLVWKAVNIFRNKTGIRQPFHIHLIKQIPMQAGLGGGSSNAATALWACNQLTHAHIPLPTLQEWGAELGADVPFFLSGGTAYCTGKGEKIFPLSPLPARSLWIIKLREGLSTPEVYRRLKLSSPSPHQEEKDDLQKFLSGTLSCFNDLEEPAFEINPSLRRLKQTLLKRGFETVLMSGSGSAFFCFGVGKPISHPDVFCFSASFINRPLSDWYSIPCSEPCLKFCPYSKSIR